jgi:hypothetical protein
MLAQGHQQHRPCFNFQQREAASQCPSPSQDFAREGVEAGAQLVGGRRWRADLREIAPDPSDPRGLGPILRFLRRGDRPRCLSLRRWRQRKVAMPQKRRVRDSVSFEMSPLTPRLGVSGCSSSSASAARSGLLSPEFASERSPSSSSEGAEERVATMERASHDIAASALEGGPWSGLVTDRGERFLLGRVHFLSLARDFLHLRVGSDGDVRPSIVSR